MKSSIRTKVTLWFVFVVLAVGIAGMAGFRRLSNYIRTEAEIQMTAKMEHVMDVLEASNTIYMDLVHSSMHVLQMVAKRSGPPTLRPGPDGTPVLYFGEQSAEGNSDIVDELSLIHI